jgi:DNA-binding NarL/FixJ family response regulator
MIKLLIADDFEAHRRRLENILKEQADMVIVSSVQGGEEAVRLADATSPNIILMDIEMEDKYAGIRASKEINAAHPDIKIIMFTVYIDDKIVFSAFQTGIVDYVVKSSGKDEIIEGIRSAYINHSPIRPIIAEKIRNEFKRTRAMEKNLLYMLHLTSTLTPSELVTLRLICTGMTRRQIAEKRFVTSETIKKQIGNILSKTGASNSRQLVLKLRECGICDVLEKEFPF